MTVRHLKLIVLTLCAFLVALSTQAFPAELSDVPAGNLVADYITALNSGHEAAMRGFLENNVNNEALKRRPVEPRLGVMRDLAAEWKSAEIKQVLEIADSAIAVLVVTKPGDWFRLTMFHDAANPPKMIGIGVEEAESTDQVDLTPMTYDEFLKEAARIIGAHAQADEFSGVVLIARHDRPVLQVAYGKADIGLGTANRTDTKFNLGSINKNFTQLAIDMLVEQGKLSYTDPIDKYLTDYPNKEAAAKVTVEHLIKMQGGIGDFFGNAYDSLPKDRFRHNRDFISLFSGEKLHFEPGTNTEYSNGGYILLGAIIEKVSGQDYYDFVRDNIFIPAGMTNTASYEADQLVDNLAQGYTTEGSYDGTRRTNIYSRPARGSAAGGGYSTTDDLFKFILAARAHKFGNASAAAYRMGIAGGAPGINADIESDLKGGFDIIVLSNYDPPTAIRLARELRVLASRVKE